MDLVHNNSKLPTRRTVSNVSLRDGLQPLTAEQLKSLTIGFYKHREQMDRKYGDDPKYFAFTRRKLNKKIETDSVKISNTNDSQFSIKVKSTSHIISRYILIFFFFIENN